MRFVFVVYSRNITENMSRASHDQIVSKLAHPITVMAAGFKELSNNVTASIENSRQTPVGFLTSGSSPGRTLLPQLDQNNFKLKHWANTLYKKNRKEGAKAKLEADMEDDGDDCNDCNDADGDSKQKKSNERSKTESITASFMENEHGERVFEASGNAVCARAKKFFNLLWKERRAPQTFGDADIETVDEFIWIMENSFPFLRYCDNHWKSEQVFRSYYPGWRSDLEKKAKAKAAAQDVTIDVDADIVTEDNQPNDNGKRPQPDNNETKNPKRRRVDEPEPVKITNKRARVCSFISLATRIADNMCVGEPIVREF